MRLADIAWKEVDSTTIRNCWIKSGILPDSLLKSATTALAVPISSLVNNHTMDKALAAAEQKLESSLSHLESIGVLQHKNRMALDELLNPTKENIMHDDGNDEEIYQAVVDRHAAEEGRDVNGSDDDIDGNVKPSRREALLAASMLREYVSDINDPFARKLEGILADFGCKTRLDDFKNFKPTGILDYFTQCSQ
ncbi:hypothetical protein H0H87_001078 [Tephrocybe sp. NHM501043]|nr:hypothetical protein H0H87_001078 [Tephrocybe sp. NHM501043]